MLREKNFAAPLEGVTPSGFSREMGLACTTGKLRRSAGVRGPAPEILSAAKDLCRSGATELFPGVRPLGQKNPKRNPAECRDGMSVLGVFRLRQAMRKRTARLRSRGHMKGGLER